MVGIDQKEGSFVIETQSTRGVFTLKSHAVHGRVYSILISGECMWLSAVLTGSVLRAGTIHPRSGLVCVLFPIYARCVW